MRGIEDGVAWIPSPVDAGRGAGIEVDCGGREEGMTSTGDGDKGRRVGGGGGSLDGEGVGSGRTTEVVAPVPRPVQETVCTVVAVSV